MYLMLFYFRVRPLNKKELKNGDDSVVSFPGSGQIILDTQSIGQKSKIFTYNVVFEPLATQEDILQHSGIKRLIEMAVEGYNCTAFCYGQTGSGKTHTLTGPPGPVDVYSEHHGLVFRSFMYLFKLLQERRDFHFVLKASFLEIYNEKVIDLLNGSSRKPLSVRWSKKSQGFFVENLFTVDCEELDDLLAVLEEGMRNRSVGRHNMNDYSSRSHTILTVHITSEQSIPESQVFISKQGKINFVDLAGSEMTKKTHSEGKTLEEANNINKSLMVLGYCIASLSDSKKKSGHIPYRDSKLTKLLADSPCCFKQKIACISPAKSNISETLNTLRYAARAKNITTKPVVVMDPRDALILSLKREVNALQNENEHLRSLLNLGRMPLESRSLLETSDGIGSKLSLSSGSIVPVMTEVELKKLADLEGQELIELVKHYMQENDALRKENSDLFSTRDILIRDQELVCRENERLLKKLEDVNSVCCRSPIIPARPTFSAEMLNGDLDSSMNLSTNAVNGELKLPQKIQNLIESRNISSTGSEGSTSSSDQKNITQKDFNESSDTSGRISTATTLPVADKNKNEHIFGSEVSLRSDTD
ncbi:Kinesin-II 85 kDa subunit, putative [Pediculus humanus corporis]|uniref:Kinesin-like protein n=1 Tax=Pediculus humanus subsp. corporis TaxID=121224 RepID=E0VPA3_PEDHC|nr:Kinesin-II 85 kDa subunit, putative [Pediculus humanus corporis]EEB15209.1 Kinesin-II 85 kDa subunit, putative [Pediculus humanus corporis]